MNKLDTAKKKLKHRGPLFGYVAASIIFTILMYVMLLDHRESEISNCESRNVTRVELNERGKTIKQLLTIEIQEGIHPNVLIVRRKATDDKLPIIDCQETNPLPWPVDLFT